MRHRIKQLFHAYRDEEALPSGEVLKEIIDLCRAILFPGYYGNARISKQTIRFHTGVNVETLHSLLSQAGLCGTLFTGYILRDLPGRKDLR